jgi:hypothetical protein
VRAAGLLLAVAPTAGATAVAGATYLAAYDHRSDYAGHMLAGCGGTLLVLGLLLVVVGRAPAPAVVGVLVAAIAAGAAVEATIFRIAIFDPVDFAHQSLGACLAAAGVLGRGGRGAGAAFALLGAVVLAAGFHYAFA